jgi:hypothetical protein
MPPETEIVKEDGAIKETDTSQFDEMSDADMENEIVRLAENAPTKEEVIEPPKQEQAQVKETPSTVQEGQVKEEPASEQKVADVVKEPTAQVEQPTEKTGTTFDELQKKQGFKSPDALANSYSDLMKKFHEKNQPAQEAVRPPVQVPVAPQGNYEDFNTKIREDMERDPVNTMSAIARMVNQGQNGQMQSMIDELRQGQAQATFRNEVNRLHSSPNTAKIDDPVVEAKMKEIMESRPEQFGTWDSMGRNFESCYWEACGRIAEKDRQEKAVNVSVPKIEPVVEGANQPITKTVFNPMTASDADFDRVLKEAWKQDMKTR